MFDKRWGLYPLLFGILLIAGCQQGNSPSIEDDQIAEVDLRDTTLQVDYLVLTREDFRDNLAPLTDARSRQGLKPLVVSTDQIDEFFADSSAAQDRIRDYVSYALQFYQKPAPQYVLLAGNFEVITGYWFESSFGEIGEDSLALDEYYVINRYEADFLPDASLGRFPISTAAELDIVVSKTLAYEAGEGLGEYDLEALLIADQYQLAANEDLFERLNQEMRSSFPPALDVIREGHVRSNSAAHLPGEELLQLLTDGSRIVHYLGEASPGRWSMQGYLNVDDLANLRGNKPFLLMAPTTFPNAVDPGEAQIIRNLLIRENNGAAMVIAASGLVYLYPGDLLNVEFYQALINSGASVGEVLLSIKRNRLPSVNNFYPLNSFYRFTIFGDPAMRLPAF